MEVVHISAQTPLLHISAAAGLDTQWTPMAGAVPVSNLCHCENSNIFACVKEL